VSSGIARAGPVSARNYYDGRDHVISLSVPPLAILDSIDVRRDARVRGREGRLSVSRPMRELVVWSWQA
jgi:hypothetical protein